MRRPIEREPEEVDSEITLSATTLLGIFFGLVLICGVFFGFGYSTGRRGSETPVTNTPTAAPDPNPAPAASPAPKPSAMETLQAAGTTPQDSNMVTESLDEDSGPAMPSQPAAAPMKQAPVSTASSKPSPVSTPAPEIKPASLPLPTSKPSGPPVMVQIAAVTRSEDANALASALRQRGYNVVVRNEPQDQLLHVQVGPFPSRDEAKLVRAKLMSDGYNPILKP